MSYEIHKITLDRDHPCWPSLECWKLYDTVHKRYGLALYLSEKRAELAAHDSHIRQNLPSIKLICEDNEPKNWLTTKQCIERIECNS